MTSFSSYLSSDHSHCDELFAEAENAVAGGDWPAAKASFDAFCQATLRHFSREEETLFPAFVARTGMSEGMTYVMRGEHSQMREAIVAMSAAIDRRDERGYLGLSESLLLLMRQHNIKEERILYPICDQALSDKAEELVGRMDVQRV